MILKQQLPWAVKACAFVAFIFVSVPAVYAVDLEESPADRAIEADSDRAIKFDAGTWRTNRKGKFRICPGRFEQKRCVDGYTIPDLVGIPAPAMGLKKYLRLEFPDDKFRIVRKSIMPTGELYVFIEFKGAP